MSDYTVTLDADQLQIHLHHLGEGHLAPEHEPLDLSVLAVARGDAEVEELIVIEEDRVGRFRQFKALEHLESTLSLIPSRVPFTDGHKVVSPGQHDDEDLVLVAAQGGVGAHVAVDSLQLGSIGGFRDVEDVDGAGPHALMSGGGQHGLRAILDSDRGGMETVGRVEILDLSYTV